VATCLSPRARQQLDIFKCECAARQEEAHVATLTVHPAYTWLYPELLSQLARIAQDLPPCPLQLVLRTTSQTRRVFKQIGANRVEHTLMMSRSVWHKLGV